MCVLTLTPNLHQKKPENWAEKRDLDFFDGVRLVRAHVRSRLSLQWVQPEHTAWSDAHDADKAARALQAVATVGAA